MVDAVAFETLGLLCEVRAVRRAMYALEGDGVQAKPWWISCTFPGPDGVFPDPTVAPDSAMKEVVSAVLQNAPELAAPTGIGINCTPSKFVVPLSVHLRKAVEELYPDKPPWAVIYPNGGHFDTDKCAWSPNDAPLWASQVVVACSNLLSSTPRERAVFSRIILGGCCNVSAGDVAVLAGAVIGAGFVSGPSGGTVNL